MLMNIAEDLKEDARIVKSPDDVQKKQQKTKEA
jgi:hypothetical protein